MDFVTGRTLRDRMLEGQLPVADAMRLAQQLLAGLAHAHAQGIVHRDLKPENLILSAEAGLEEHLRILDFGLAKLRDGPAMTAGMAVGTPSYMSPEQSGAEGEIDARTDIYTVGVLLFELLAGRKPFQSDNVGEVILMHRKRRRLTALRRAPQYSEELDGLVQKRCPSGRSLPVRRRSGGGARGHARGKAQHAGRRACGAGARQHASRGRQGAAESASATRRMRRPSIRRRRCAGAWKRCRPLSKPVRHAAGGIGCCSYRRGVLALLNRARTAATAARRRRPVRKRARRQGRGQSRRTAGPASAGPAARPGPENPALSRRASWSAAASPTRRSPCSTRCGPGAR
jgi:hypothetical protein